MHLFMVILISLSRQKAISHWISKGCPSNGAAVTETYQDKESAFEAHARCCGGDGSCISPATCNSGTTLTFAEAEALCATYSKTLCTKAELASAKCCGTGGGCDAYGIWTLDKACTLKANPQYIHGSILFYSLHGISESLVSTIGFAVSLAPEAGCSLVEAATAT